MARRRKLWFVIADGEHARIVTPSAAGSFQTIASVDAADAHRRSQALGTDRPGRSFESGNASRRAIEPKHDPHAMSKQKFQQFIAERVNEASNAGSFERLVLVAPSRTMPIIRDALDVETLEKLVGTLTKDLIKTPDHELGAHLADWAIPAPQQDQ